MDARSNGFWSFMLWVLTGVTLGVASTVYGSAIWIGAGSLRQRACAHDLRVGMMSDAQWLRFFIGTLAMVGTMGAFMPDEGETRILSAVRYVVLILKVIAAVAAFVYMIRWMVTGHL